MGLPLAMAAVKSGYRVSGIEKNLNKVDLISKGISPVEDVDDFEILDSIRKGKFHVSNDFEQVKGSEFVVICVPTPLTKQQEPDLSFVYESLESFAKYLDYGTTVILESTVSPGMTRNDFIPKVLSVSGKSEKDLYFAYSPERVDPSNNTWKIDNTPKLVAGFTKTAQLKAIEFYSKFVSEVVVCDSLEIAESAKLLENSYRLINISFINEFAMFCKKFSIDVLEVIAAASSKPYGFMPFYPSVGIGGHCIPVDPLYLKSVAQKIGAPTNFIDLANDINLHMPNYFVTLAADILNDLTNRKILVIGVSYKPNVSDVRETPVQALIDKLRAAGAEVSWHDDLVKIWNKEKSTPLSQNFDLAILATPHSYIDLKKLGDVPMLDTRGSI